MSDMVVIQESMQDDDCEGSSGRSHDAGAARSRLRISMAAQREIAGSKICAKNPNSWTTLMGCGL